MPSPFPYREGRDLKIANNRAERSLLGIAVGQKNWLLFGSDNGGRTAVVLTSFIATCKRLEINPFTYLRDIFDRTRGRPAKTPREPSAEQVESRFKRHPERLRLIPYMPKSMPDSSSVYPELTHFLAMGDRIVNDTVR